MVDRRQGQNAEIVMPVSDLHGRTVWSEDGDRLGTVRGVNTDDEGRIVSFDVRERWMLGKHHDVPATEMRMEGGDVIVPTSAVRAMQTREARPADDTDRRTGDVDGRVDHDDTSVTREQVASDDAIRVDEGIETHRVPAAATAGAPMFLAGREGAKGRFGGLDLIGSFFGALVTIASVMLIGGILSAIFGTDVASFDTAVNSLESLLDEALVIGAVTLLASSFLGGWCAGRSARFDGVGNGLMTVVWVLAIGVLLGALTAWVGSEYDVFGAANLPSFSTDDFALWGIVGFAVAIGLMLLGAALGGMLGEAWHRRADREMFQPVEVDRRP